MDPFKPASIDEYISAFPVETQQLLEQIRTIVKSVAPEANEVISYSMPAFKLNGILVYFAGYKNHIGLYPLASGIEVFKDELAAFKWAKGSIQFPLNKPLPVDLITRIVSFRADENRRKKRKK